MLRVMRIFDNDSVATALQDVGAGETAVLVDSNNSVLESLMAVDPIPFGHKIALLDMEKGADVIKYGKRIGAVCSNIKRGQFVHVHNVKSLMTEIPDSTKSQVIKLMGIEKNEEPVT